jgi:WD40 repeat protein
MTDSHAARQIDETRDDRLAKDGVNFDALTSRGELRRPGDVFKRCAADLPTIGALTAAVAVLAALFGPEPGPASPRPRIIQGEHRAQLTSLAFSPTATQMAITDTAGQVALRSTEAGWLKEQFLEFPGYASTTAFSPDGRLLVAVGNLSCLWVWDLSSSGKTPTSTTTLPIYRARHVVFSPDGRSLAITSDASGTILIWDLPTGRERRVLHQTSPVVRIAFSPDGTRLATSERDQPSISLWDLETGSRHVFRQDTPGVVMALAFSPDGSMLATASSAEHDVRLWDLNTGRVRRVLRGHERSVNSVAFSPDGSLLATAGNDGTIGVWVVATGDRCVSLDGHAHSVATVAFSPDGLTLALATLDDDDIRIWNVAEILASTRTTTRVSRPTGGEIHGNCWSRPTLFVLT